MIVVDSSAIVAIALGEPEASAFSAIVSNSACRIASPTLLETHMVLAGRVPARADVFMRDFLVANSVKVEPFTAEMAQIACAAFDRHGKGRHPAKLNFGDCISYAFAKSLGVPLLFKGDDFPLTDICPAFRP